MSSVWKGNAAWMRGYFLRHPEASIDDAARDAFRVHKGLKKTEISRIHREVKAERERNGPPPDAPLPAVVAREAALAALSAMASPPTTAAPAAAEPAVTTVTTAEVPRPVEVKLPSFGPEAIEVGKQKRTHAGGETRKSWLSALLAENPGLTFQQCHALLLSTFGMAIQPTELARLIRTHQGGPVRVKHVKPPKRKGPMPVRYRKLRVPEGLTLPPFSDEEIAKGRGGRFATAIAVRRKWLDVLVETHPTLSLDQCQRLLYETFGAALSNDRVLEVLKIARELAAVSGPVKPPAPAAAPPAAPPAAKASRASTLEDELRHLLKGLRDMAQRHSLARAQLTWNGTEANADYLVAGAVKG